VNGGIKEKQLEIFYSGLYGAVLIWVVRLRMFLLIDNSCQDWILFSCLKRIEKRKNMGGNDACITSLILPCQKKVL